MIKKLSLFMVILLVVVGAASLMLQNIYAQPFAGGSGTTEDPYRVATAAHLDNIRGEYLDKHFRQTADINLGVAPWKVGEGWEPIGTSGSPFTGSFDGAGHVIYNLVVNRPGTNYQGLFGYLDGAVIHNVSLQDIHVRGNTYTGGLAGYALNSAVDRLQVTGEVSGGAYTGGIIGSMFGGSLFYISTDASVLGAAETGGLAGRTDGFTLTVHHAFTLGTVQGTVYGDSAKIEDEAITRYYRLLRREGNREVLYSLTSTVNSIAEADLRERLSSMEVPNRL